MVSVLSFGLWAGLACGPAEPVLGTLYLFDCSGRIQRLDEATGELSTVRFVAEIDVTLPDRVRDGCAGTSSNSVTALRFAAARRLCKAVA